MNVYDITVSVRIRCQAGHVGEAEDLIHAGVQDVLGEWVDKLQELPEDADKPLVLEEVAEFASERVVTGTFWRDGALVN